MKGKPRTRSSGAPVKPKWLFFSYSLPQSPSKSRVYVWRQLKKLGAVNYQSSWILPFSQERVNELRKLMKDIEGFKGESLIIEGKALDSAQEEQIRGVFLKYRDEEYQEVIQKCDDFRQEIENEIAKENFTFAEVEENEEEIEKLKKWLKKIDKRDVLGAQLRKTAMEKIKGCEKVYEDFAKRVYEKQK